MNYNTAGPSSGGAGTKTLSAGVPLHLAGDLQTRIRLHALQEAARRLKEREAARAAESLEGVQREGSGGVEGAEGDEDGNAAGGSTSSPQSRGRKSMGDMTGHTSIFLDGKPVEEESDRHVKLLVSLTEERNRNDAEWASVQRSLAQIRERTEQRSDQTESDLARRIREKEIQFAQMQFEIEHMNSNVAELGPDSSFLTRDIKARGSAADMIEQLEDELLEAETDVAKARRALASETQLLSDLNLVHEGMLSRQAQLERRSTQLTEEELIDQLRSKLKASETKLGDLLGALIRTSNDLFADDDATLRPQLRSFLDALMNRSWDKPTDPYVEIGRYPKVLANFLLRANVAQEHPRDARKLRLIPFQKGNRS